MTLPGNRDRDVPLRRVLKYPEINCFPDMQMYPLSSIRNVTRQDYPMQGTARKNVPSDSWLLNHTPLFAFPATGTRATT